jgi:hypothetical protein
MPDHDEPVKQPAQPPAPTAMLFELARLIREIAASPDRDISEATAWLHERGL